MAIEVRRVVTGHDKNGKAVILKDEISPHARSSRSGVSSTVIWSTPSFPPDNNNDTDGGQVIGGTIPGGTVFRISRHEPGEAPRPHRTNSLDYVIVLQGEMTLILDDSEVVLKAGDTAVQRGTIHNWANRGTEPVVIAYIMLSCPPVTAGGKTLEAKG